METNTDKSVSLSSRRMDNEYDILKIKNNIE